ncbi:MAG: BON domain-containing protein [Planctomycetaceae bacterium]|nr:BON domain-containing protein [Planctomycetaceae bacterium]
MIPLRRQPDWNYWVEVARAALAQSASFHGRNLDVEVEEESLVLRGVVRNEFQRAKVYQAVRKAVGNTPLENEIEVAVD